MRRDLRWLVVFLSNLAFLLLIGQANHHLSRIALGPADGPVFLFLLGLPLSFAALRLDLHHAVAVAALTGLASEAGLPLPHGLFALSASACVALTIAVRGNFNRFEPSSAILVGLLINAFLVIVVSIATGALLSAVSGLRVMVDLILSQMALALLTGWFFSGQLALLRFFGFNLETELRQPS